MNRRIKFLLFLFLAIGQIVVNRYIDILKINIDLLFLILVFISVKSGFLKSILSAAVIGLVTDFLSGNILGVFGFSRTIAAYLISELSTYLDLRKNTFLFLLIVLPLFISNLIANIFFYFILGYPIGLHLLLYPPLLTGLAGLLIVSPAKMKEYLDVY
jgi:rod shape-determining protein MreD